MVAGVDRALRGEAAAAAQARGHGAGEHRVARCIADLRADDPVAEVQRRVESAGHAEAEDAADFAGARVDGAGEAV